MRSGLNQWKPSEMRSICYSLILTLLALAGQAAAQPAQQVNVSVKIIEFQSSKQQERGLSAYFKRRQETAWGQVRTRDGVSAADVTFPTTSTLGLTVFIDRLAGHYGDYELVLQGLVDQGRAFILSKPKVMAMVNAEKPTVIETTENVPYEETRVLGSTATQITAFHDTGVRLEVTALQVVDDDGNPDTPGDNFIQLKLVAKVDEEGARVPVALDDRVNSEAGNFINVPQFNSRSIDTTVWVQEGQVLILGGLYLNRKTKDLKTLPWFSQTEDFLNSTLQRYTPFNMPEMPLTSSLGQNQSEFERRELVFVLKTDIWHPHLDRCGHTGFRGGNDRRKEAHREPRRRDPRGARGYQRLARGHCRRHCR